MATIIHGNTGRDVYPEVLTKIRLFGVSRPSRNGPTRDLGHVTIALDGPYDALALGLNRGLSRRVAAAEAIQLIGGFSDPDWLVERAPGLSPYREPSGVFWGAYGVRIGRQLRDVVRKLRADPWTRQAVVTLWDPDLDNESARLDYPCTVALGFVMRPTPSGGRELDLNVTMRSNDAWLGLPYDVFQFTQIQHTVAHVLSLWPGRYTHTAWSLHMYDRDVEASHRVTADGDESRFDPTGFGEPDVFIDVDEVVRRARVVALTPEKIDWELTPSERWYCDVLHKA